MNSAANQAALLLHCNAFAPSSLPPTCEQFCAATVVETREDLQGNWNMSITKIASMQKRLSFAQIPSLAQILLHSVLKKALKATFFDHKLSEVMNLGQPYCVT